MLTRLRVKGFKNLVDCDVGFGPFTCIAGANASGKSNLFDTITLLRDLADFPIVEAASRVRDPAARSKGDFASLFSFSEDNLLQDIDIEAEFIVPSVVKDDFGRDARPSSTHLKYRVVIGLVSASKDNNERLELKHESLTYIPKSDSRKHLEFRHSNDFWQSIIGGARRADFISTEENELGQAVIRLRQDGVSGRPLDVLAKNSPRTLLGTINTDDRPTALAARREMQSWTFLQLEPSKLRLPDDFSDDARVTADGSHMPATLAKLGCYAEVANKLSSLIPDVRAVDVDVDEGRRLKTILVTQRNGSKHTARNLSDGTLRFLALAIIGLDTESSSVICLEEPENGIHPSRVAAMMELLHSISVDPGYAVGPENPLRQVIINTHSPVVVQSLSVDELLVSVPIKRGSSSATVFAPIQSSWRAAHGRTPAFTGTVPIGALLSYLNDDLLEKQAKKPSVEAQNVLDYVRGQLSLF